MSPVRLFNSFISTVFFLLLSLKYSTQQYKTSWTYKCLEDSYSDTGSSISSNPGYNIIIYCNEADAILNISNCLFFSVWAHRDFFDERSGKLYEGNLGHSLLYDNRLYPKEEKTLGNNNNTMNFVVPKIPFINACDEELKMKFAENFTLHFEYNDIIYVNLEETIGEDRYFLHDCASVDLCKPDMNISLSENMIGTYLKEAYFIYNSGTNIYSNVGYIYIYRCCENCDYDESTNKCLKSCNNINQQLGLSSTNDIYAYYDIEIY